MSWAHVRKSMGSSLFAIITPPFMKGEKKMYGLGIILILIGIMCIAIDRRNNKDD